MSLSKHYTVMLLSEESHTTRRLHVSHRLLMVVMAMSSVLLGVAVFVVSHYLSLRGMQHEYREALSEREHMRSEASLVSSQLEVAKKQLKKVDSYMANLSELVAFKVDRVSKRAGIGPLTAEEERIHHRNQLAQPQRDNADRGALGIVFDDFVFRPLIQEIHTVDKLAYQQSNLLKQLLLTLQQKRHLFSSIPLGKPVKGWVTSGYGYRISPFTGQRTMHYGIDIAARVGSPVYAPASGVVIFSGKKPGFGLLLMIAHDHGMVTKYGHNSELFVQTGEKVQRGDPIAAVGSSGRSTGPHLHYEVWVNGRARDPRKFMMQTDLAWNFAAASASDKL
ncbi:MAG: M23 family metallopeptidase [Proteobacteria bacterium]|nr:M23 family metallopeptidase [Pseudomonadota bacterium]